MKHAIILGCPRSGTTFLSRVLGAIDHSELIIGNHLPVSVPHLVASGMDGAAREALLFGFRHSLENYLDHARNSRFDALHKFMIGRCGGSEMLDAWRGKRRLEILIFKEPYLAFSPRFAYETFFDTRIIHIVRDGRDCADSLVRSYDALSDESLLTLEHAEAPLGRKMNGKYIPWWVRDGLEAEFDSASPFVRCVWMWSEMMNRCIGFFAQEEVAGAGRVLEIRYEDLIRDPREQIRMVLEHLDVPLNPRIRKQLGNARSSSVKIHQRLPAREIEDATEIAREELAHYGYL